MKVYGLGAPPATAAVQMQQQNRAMQNAMTKRGGCCKRGGAVEVTQFPQTGVQVSPDNANTSAVRLANLQQQSGSILTAQSSVGKPVGGRSRRRRRRRKCTWRIFGF
jgi:hypothetical protein